MHLIEMRNGHLWSFSGVAFATCKPLPHAHRIDLSVITYRYVRFVRSPLQMTGQYVEADRRTLL